jgi:hypothetical protein
MKIGKSICAQSMYLNNNFRSFRSCSHSKATSHFSDENCINILHFGKYTFSLTFLINMSLFYHCNYFFIIYSGF